MDRTAGAIVLGAALIAATIWFSRTAESGYTLAVSDLPSGVWRVNNRTGETFFCNPGEVCVRYRDVTRKAPLVQTTN
jgi:hypothetical protein